MAKKILVVEGRVPKAHVIVTRVGTKYHVEADFDLVGVETTRLLDRLNVGLQAAVHAIDNYYPPAPMIIGAIGAPKPVKKPKKALKGK
jgi:hypothetical protein